MAKEKSAIVILHGWKLNGEKYKKLKQILEKDYRVFAPDMPGFGKNELRKDLALLDYARFLKTYLAKNEISNPVLLGHSFGGRVIVKFLKIYKYIPVAAIILTGTPLTKQPLSFQKKAGRALAKIAKPLLSPIPYSSKQLLRRILYKSIGEYDYYKSGNLRKTFVHIVNEDLSGYLNGIQTPTLILWGENDKITPLSIAYGINKMIKNSKLEIIKGETHKIPYDNPAIFAQKAKEFLSKNY